MTLTYPSQWASTYNFDRDRVDIEKAVEFVNSVQNLQFGHVIESHNLNVEETRNPEEDPVYQSEKELNEAIGSVADWLLELAEGGQQTISTNKVCEKIEEETGLDFIIN